MQKITPNLWFAGTIEEAAYFYVDAFSRLVSSAKSAMGDISRYPESSADGLADFQQDLAGKPLTASFTLAGLDFMGINGGADFQPNPSISFFVNFEPSRDDQAREHLDGLWQELSAGGKVLMELDTYPFSEHYGWVQDRYGISWQLMLADTGAEPRLPIMPLLMFNQQNTNHAEEAINFYASIFKDSKVGNLARYGQPTGPASAEALTHGNFQLAGQWFGAMDSGVEQDFSFNNGISLSIACQDQAEIDYFWDKLSADPEAEQCGWCKDKYGVSWQVVPANMGDLMQRPGAFQHMMEMKKLVIAEF